MNDIIKQTTFWFVVAHADQGHQKRTVQLGVHFEEVGEMIAALQSTDPVTTEVLQCAAQAIEDLASHLKTNSKTAHLQADPLLLLDSLCDQTITAAGVAYDFGFQFPQALREVNRSNFSKFVNGAPVFDENGKIKKGPDYTPPNLVSYVN